MAEESAQPVTDEKEFGRLKDEFLKVSRYKHYPFLSRLEEPKDRVYILTIRSGDKVLGNVRYRKWTHGEVGHFLKLPFYQKIALGKEFTEQEKIRFEALKAEMVNLAILDHGRWVEFSHDQKFIDTMFVAIQQVSGMDVGFSDGLADFFDTDMGFMYGYIWFHEMRKAPSEVAELSESDVNAVMTWYGKWFERVKEKQ